MLLRRLASPASAMPQSPHTSCSLQALRRNPYAPVVPCHRVIAADLSIGGFKGVTGTHTDTIKSKRTMLCEEGVVFDADSFNVAKGSCLGSDELAEAVKVAGVKLTKHDST